MTVAYDGTHFHGWAKQPGHRTIQGSINEILSDFTGSEVLVSGASRTDSGAHALGQVCHFDSSLQIPPDGWRKLINDRAPNDLSIIKAQNVPLNFDSRFCAVYRHYRYRILIGPRFPHLARYAHYLRNSSGFDISKMQKAASLLVGKHDFYGFSQETPIETNTVRELYSVHPRKIGHEIWIDIQGTAFVKGMMRRISGALLEVAMGRRALDSFKRLLAPSVYPDIEWPEVLPANGLTLMEVNYGRKLRDIRD